MKRAWESQGQKLNKRLKLLPTNGKAENIAEAKKKREDRRSKKLLQIPRREKGTEYCTGFNRRAEKLFRRLQEQQVHYVVSDGKCREIYNKIEGSLDN